MKTGLIAFGFAVLGASSASGQEFPTRPVRIVVSIGGGSGDVSARMIAPRVSQTLGQQMVVETRAGAIVGETVSKSPPDGYTLLLDATSLWVGPLLQDASYDVLRDFAPISTTDRAPSVVAVPPSLPVSGVREFVALAKARPGELNYGTGQAGTLSHLAAELLKAQTGINIVRVPYKGGGQAVIAAIANEVQLVFNGAGSISQHIRSGKLKALGVASPQPTPLLPTVPTIASQGLPGFEATLFQGILAPAKTPVAVVRKLNQEIVRALSSEELREKYLSVGFEASPSTPEEFVALIRSETAKWGRLIKEAGIKAD